MPADARILVADDESSQRRLLRAYLDKEGYAVVEADNGQEALAVIRAGDVDVALVDVMMPGLDGFEVVRQARTSSEIPIILLTARGEEVNRVAGLELGADDYVVKPFSAPEVIARVRTQLRRLRGSRPQARFRVGRVELDPVSRRCTADGREVELTRRQFDLLSTLLESPGRVFTREQLLDRVWGSQFVSAKTVDVHIAALRRLLGDAISISALRGVGYRLDPETPA